MALLRGLGLVGWTLWQHRVTRQPPERVLAVQNRRLRRLLRFAVARSEFYRQRYRGIDTDRCALSDLPITTKAELMADFDRAVTDPRVRRTDVERFIDDPANVGRLFRGRHPLCHTSGSTGQPMLVVQDRASIELLFAFQMTRGNTDYGFGPLVAARRLVAPARLAVIASRRGFFPSASAWAHLPAGLSRFVRVQFVDAGDPRLAERLRALNPTVITGYAAALEQLAAESPRLPALRQLVNTCETLARPARDRLRAAFGVPVLDTYAAGECLFLSNGCPTHPGAHINADYCVLEVVDADSRPVPPGRPGDKVLLTNLANRTQPLIRYEIGDRVALADTPCACGSRLPRLAAVDGRTGDAFWVRAGNAYARLTSYPFINALEHLRDVREWQARHERRNHVVVRLEPLPGRSVDPDRARHVLTDFLRTEVPALADHLHLQCEAVDRLTPDARTGKFRRFIDLVGEPGDVSPRPEVVPLGSKSARPGACARDFSSEPSPTS
jgi:phenylacetate-coenzyme A ligase PaaK-like adenylate-forming protein